MDNITFFDEDFVNIIENPYGSNVCEKVLKHLTNIILNVIHFKDYLDRYNICAGLNKKFI